MNSFKEIINYFDEEVKFVFESIDDAIVSRITEIRIRRNMPVIISIRNTCYFVDYNGDIYDYPCHNSVVINGDSFDNLFLKLCDYSVYSSMENMKKGYITLSNGSRIGIASTKVSNENIKNITSLNIRISREIEGIADSVLNFLYVNSFPSIIVAGKPNSGKTTLLRDLAYQLSNGFNGRYSKVAIIDERNEITGKINFEFSTKIGVNTDVLSGFDKATGIEIATRTLSPDLIVCDEISTIEELNSINYAFSSGVAFALSVHINNEKDIIRKPIMKNLVLTQQFDYIVLLDKHTYKTKIIDTSEVKIENNWNASSDDFFNRSGDSHNINSAQKI